MDWFFPAEINEIEQPNQQTAFKVRLRVRQDQQLKHLMDLLEEWGYQSRVIL